MKQCKYSIDSLPRTSPWNWLVAVGVGLLLPSCSGDKGSAGAQGELGPQGEVGTGCTATDNLDGTYTVDCDGDIVTVSDGTDGGSCSVADNLDGTKTITCDDGTVVTVSDGPEGPSGELGFEGGPFSGDEQESCAVCHGEDRAYAVANYHGPANASEASRGTNNLDNLCTTITNASVDGNGNVVIDLAIAASGADEIPCTGDDVPETGVADSAIRFTVAQLIPEDGNGAPSYWVNYINTVQDLCNLPGSWPAPVGAPESCEGNTSHDIWNQATYERGDTSGTWTDNADGTYQYKTAVDISAGIAITSPPNAMNVAYDASATHRVATQLSGGANNAIYDFVPDASALVTRDVVNIDNCNECHKTLAMHGSGRLDTKYCVTCHNPTTGDPVSGNPLDFKIMIHKIHMGKHLPSVGAGDEYAIWGYRNSKHDYTHVGFPADVRTCDKCHKNAADADNWKDVPSRAACGSCHDNIDYVAGTFDPPITGGSCTVDGDCTADLGASATCNTTSGKCELAVHFGGTGLTDDTECATCHTATPGTGLSPIPDAHDVTWDFEYTVDLTMTAPANGGYYVAGEAPVVTIVVSDATSGTPIDHDVMEADVSRAHLFVSGPRAKRLPTLTTAAEGPAAIRAQVRNGDNGPWNFSAAADLRLSIDGNNIVVAIPATCTGFADCTAATMDEVMAWLEGDSGFNAVATASAYISRGATKVTIKSNTIGAGSSVQIQVSDVQDAMSFDTDEHLSVDTKSYSENFLYQHDDPLDDDPRTTWSAGNIQYQLDDVDGLEPGTYSVWVEFGSTSYPVSWALKNFQVGTVDIEPKVATSCTDCHEDNRMHAGYFGINFNPDICGSCHDYLAQQIAWGTTWKSGGNNMGFGAAPLSRRIHGVHFGADLDKPEEVHDSYDYSHLEFPQDVRNCTKCHSESDSWMENPNRLACNGCHDSDAAIAHTAANTVDPTPLSEQ